MSDARSDFLFARASLIDGMARILDIGGTLVEFNASPSAEIADELAMSMDWVAVASGLFAAMHRTSEEIEPLRGRESDLTPV